MIMMIIMMLLIMMMVAVVVKASHKHEMKQRDAEESDVLCLTMMNIIYSSKLTMLWTIRFTPDRIM